MVNFSEYTEPFLISLPPAQNFAGVDDNGETVQSLERECSRAIIPADFGDPIDPIGGGVIDPSGPDGPVDPVDPFDPVEPEIKYDPRVDGATGDPIFDPPGEGGGPVPGTFNPINNSANQQSFANQLNDISQEPRVLDPMFNYSVPEDGAFLRLANVSEPTTKDTGRVLTPTVNKAINDVLRGDGGFTYVPWNGTTVGSVLNRKGIIEESLGEDTKKAIEELTTNNLQGIGMQKKAIAGIKNSLIKGTTKNLSPSMLMSLANEAKLKNPKGLPKVTNSNASSKIIEFARNKRKSLYPKVYSINHSRIAQKYRVLPEDVNLSLQVKTALGNDTCVRFKNDDTLSIAATGGTEELTHLNEFMDVIDREGTTVTVPLNSDRHLAYTFDLLDESVLQSMTDLSKNPVYQLEITARSNTTAASLDNVEVTSYGNDIPEAILLASDRSTIRKAPKPNKYLESTYVEYNKVWTSEQSNWSNFNQQVTHWSGPRCSIFIPYDDPIWNIILEYNSVKVKFTDFTYPVDGKIYCKKIFTDIMLFPTDRIEYNPFQGNSILSQYKDDLPIERTLKIVLNPSDKLRKDTYVKTRESTNGRNSAGQIDLLERVYKRGFDAGSPTNAYSISRTPFTTSPSIFGTFLNVAKTINENYNLSDDIGNKSMPRSDLFSFFTVNEYMRLLLEVPNKTLQDMYNGVFTGVESIPVYLTDKIKTKITQDTLTGDSLENQQLQIVAAPNSQYFSSAFRNKTYVDHRFYRQEYLSRTAQTVRSAGISADVGKGDPIKAKPMPPTLPGLANGNLPTIQL